MRIVTQSSVAAVAAFTAAALPGPSFSQLMSSSGQRYLQENLPVLSSCLTGKARELDDGRSDTAAIAAAMASACQKVELGIYAGYAKIMGADPIVVDSPAGQQMLRNLERQAVVVMLKERAAKAGQQK
jgi:hypothetical protein